MTQTESTPTSCTVGVLDYKKFSGQLLPLVERARTKGDSAAVDEIRAMLMGIDDGDLKLDALSQLDRIDVAVQSRRWHPSAAGFVLEAACVDDPAVIPDLMSTLNSASDFLYDWNEEKAEAIFQFFGFLSDRTLRWASPPDSWRAIVPPEALADPTDALSALSPRALRKMLIEAEDGNVFSEQEALDLSLWWEAIRKAVRVAAKTDCGFYICVEQPD